MVNKARLVEKVAELVKEKRLEGISDIRDESDRNGMRIVFELKKDAVGAVVLNNLFKMTALQSSFGVNMLAIVDAQPKLLTLKDALQYFIDHRRDVVTRRSLFELREARARQEIVEGLGIAVDNIDRVIQIIRSSSDPDEAKESLMAEPFMGLAEFLKRAGRPQDEIEQRTEKGDYLLTERQAQAILDMRLQRLTGLERDKLDAEYRELCITIDRLEGILSDPAKLLKVITDELTGLREQFGDERRTTIVDDEGEIAIEELIADEDMVVTMSHAGLHQAQLGHHLSRAEARRARHHRRVEQGRGLRRQAVRRVDARPRADVHLQGARLLQEGLRAARGLAQLARQGAGQRARAQRERARRRDAAAQGLRAGQVHHDGDRRAW